jgi:exodeoxyribonuclease-5
MAQLYDVTAALNGLNSGQQEALLKLANFASSSNPARYFILRGYAGTGKTFLMNRLCSVLPQGKVYMTATTNKAAKVLRSKVPVECSTIYSLIGLRLSDDDEQPQLLPPEESKKRNELRGAVVVVDECSMITAELLKHIMQFAITYGVKFIFVGDPAQLPPVEKDAPEGHEIESPVWYIDDADGYTLSEIVRYDGPIEKVAGYLRDMVFDVPATDNYITVSQDVREDRSGVYRIGALKMDAWIMDAAKRGLLLDDNNKAIILAFTNKQVEYYNNMARSAMFPEATITPFYLGERIVMTGAFTKGEGKERQCIARNRDEFRIVGIEEKYVKVSDMIDVRTYIQDDDYSAIQQCADWRYRVIDLICIAPDTSETVTLPVIHPESVELFNNILNRISKFAKHPKTEQWQRRVTWKEFWAHKGRFAQVAYAYAMTTHCSQGSTYDIVFTDMSNIMGVKLAPLKTRLQSLYVAVTRASKMVIIN